MRVTVCLVVLAFIASEGQAQVTLVSEKKAKWISKLKPKTDDEEINAVLNDPSTIWYTDEEMPPAYQNNGNAHWTKYNISAVFDESKKGDGNGGNANVEFPWKVPGGTHRSPGVRSYKFMWLPKDESGKAYPVVYFPFRAKDASISWVFPKGTVFGELLTLETPMKTQITFELRVRKRDLIMWEVDIFRPYSDAEELATAIKEKRPQWEQNPDLVLAVQNLEKGDKRYQFTLNDTLHPVSAFESGTVEADRLSDLGETELVTELLLRRTFKSNVGTDWFPTTNARYHIVPQNYLGAILGSDSESCMKCHDSAHKHADDFDRPRDWYGRVRGANGIFSWHPYAPSAVSRNGFNITPTYRPEFVQAGIFVPYNPDVHSTDMYKRISGLN